MPPVEGGKCCECGKELSREWYRCLDCYQKGRRKHWKALKAMQALQQIEGGRKDI